MSGNINSGVQDIPFVAPVTKKYSNFNENLVTDASKPSLCCDVCHIKVTSLKILQRHLDGRKHKLRTEKKGKEYICETCELKANSETQLNIHLNSSKHRARLVRKEYNEFTDISKNSRALWVLIFCAFCIFLNLFIIFFKSF